MCGNHQHGNDDHHHGPRRTIFRPRLQLPDPIRTRSRRAFLGEVGRGTLAMAVVTPLAVACSSSDDDGATASDGDGDGATTEAEASSTTAAPTEDTTSGDAAADDTPGDDNAAAEPIRWARANLGFVSAYVLARGNSAAIVDTGVSGSADAIGTTLAELGLNYDDVDHVILTHHHGDHAGSIAEVVSRAPGAAIYAGEADLDQITGESIIGLTGGEDVFGLEMLATPGHTEGHMAVIDHTAGLLVAGDAIFTEDGGVIEGPERFFDDIPTSHDTIRALAELSFNTLLVGHGEPIEAAADTAVAALAASLP